MFGKLAAFGTALVVGAVLLLGLLGWLAPADNALRDFRAELSQRPATGNIVFVDIDSATLEKVGVWPWPRRVHAEIVDRLMELGASDVVLDIDFSTASNEVDDAALEAALDRAGGFVLLAAFRQLPHDDASAFNLPIERFRAVAEPVLVNVGIDTKGVVRTYPYAAVINGQGYPSVATALSGKAGPAGTEFVIDYSIDARRIPHVSAADLLDGKVDQSSIEGLQVIVGASALELRDVFVVPVAGAIAGALVQAIATETLLQGRALQPLGPTLPLLIIALIALVSMPLRGRISLRTQILGAASVSILVEIAAFVLQAQFAELLDTSVIHIAQTAIILRSIALDLGLKRFLHLQVSHERDAMRSILDRVISDNFDGVVVIEESGKIIAASKLAEELLGAGLNGRLAREVLPRQIDRAVRRIMEAPTPQPHAPPAELLLPTQDNEARIIEYSITLSEVKELERRVEARTRRVACLTFRDISERRHNEQRLNYLVSHDPLTGAWSRLKLVEMIDALMVDDRTRANGVTVILIDLGRFKTVNDTLGHSYGDMVLKQVVSRLKACEVEAVARLGGDSFALARPGTMAPDDLGAFCSGVLERVTQAYHLEGGHQALIAASAGATTSDVSGYDPQVLISHADMALSAAKRRPGSSFAVFSPEMDERLKEKQDMEVALRLALERNELSVTYQPQVDLDSGRMIGVEALVRWHHPELGTVSPTRFIPAAEETGQMVEIGRFVLRTACVDAMGWPEHIRLAVNVSPMQFELVDVAAEVREALSLSGLPPSRLDLEITEGLFMSRDRSITDALERLREMGIGIALDDFGTGYSSLSYLGRLPVDKIKIDQSFVSSLPADQEAGAIIRAVMTLSETLNKVVVAEGVENADQAWMLRILGCRIGQGYHFGRPKTAVEMREMMADAAKVRVG